MGGNALLQVGLETRRLMKDEYVEVTTRILDTMRNHINIALVPAYRNKESFGDADFVVNLKDPKENMRDLIVKHLKPTHYVKNGNCYSFNIGDFQVDFIYHNEDIFRCALNYYSWNDLGNLMGRIAYKMGFKYGHDGLTFEYKDGDHAFRDIHISSDAYEIAAFLGFDEVKLYRGFNDLEDIFKFVAESAYFSPNIFLLENRNHKSRIRDRKRKTYTQFLEWCEKLDTTNFYKWDNEKEHGGRVYVDWSMDKAFFTWPDFFKRYEQTEKDYEAHLKYKELFNGEIISELTGLKEKELGMFMKHFIEKHGGKERWKALVLNDHDMDLLGTIGYHFEQYKNNRERQCLSLNINVPIVVKN